MNSIVQQSLHVEKKNRVQQRYKMAGTFSVTQGQDTTMVFWQLKRRGKAPDATLRMPEGLWPWKDNGLEHAVYTEDKLTAVHSLVLILRANGTHGNKQNKTKKPCTHTRDDLGAKSTNCSFRGPGLNSQQPCGGSEPSAMRPGVLFWCAGTHTGRTLRIK